MLMPFPRNWSEELISEWLQIDGHLVETGVVLSTIARGRRMEADVLGVKIRNDGLIIHNLEIDTRAISISLLGYNNSQ